MGVVERDMGDRRIDRLVEIWFALSSRESQCGLREAGTAEHRAAVRELAFSYQSRNCAALNHAFDGSASKLIIQSSYTKSP